MRQDNINYLVVGTFVLLMLMTLMYALFRITGQSANKDIYYTRYNNVTGIKRGTTVTYAGYPVGTVLDIEPIRQENRTHYQVSLGIEGGWPVPDNSTARIVRPGILTEQQINISEGNSRKLLKPGETIRSLATVDLMDLLNVMAGEFQDISDESLKPMIDNIGKHLDRAGLQLNSNIPDIAKNAGQLLDNLNVISGEMRDLFDKNNKERLAHMFNNTNEMAKSLARLTKNLDKASVQVEDILQRSSNILKENNDDIRASILDLRRSLDTVSGSIDGIVHNLSVSSRNMNEITREIRANPGLILNSKPAEMKQGEQ